MTNFLTTYLFILLVFFTPNKHAWLEVSEGFSNYWNIPNCVGAMDGKHIVQCSSGYNLNNRSDIIMNIK